MAADEIQVGRVTLDNSQAVSALEATGNALREAIRSGQLLVDANGRIRESLGGTATAARSAEAATTALVSSQQRAAQGAERASSGITGLAATITNMNTSMGRAQVATDRLDSQVSRLFARATGGRAFAMDIRLMGQAFEAAGNSAASAGTRIRGFVAGGLLAVQAAEQLARRVVAIASALIETAEAAEQTRHRLDALGDRMEAVNAATGGMSNSTQAFATQQELLRAHLNASGQQLGAIIEEGREYARVHGGTATEATERLARAISTTNREELSQYGVQLRGSGTAAENLAQITEQLTQRQQRFGVLQGDLGERIERVKNVMGGFLEQLVDLGRNIFSNVTGISQFLELLGRGVSLIERLTEAMRVANEWLARHGAAHRESANAARANDEALAHLSTTAQATTNSLTDLKNALSGVDTGFHAGESAAESYARRLSAFRERIAQHNRQLAQDRQIAAALGADNQTLSAVGLGDVAGENRRGTASARREETVRELRETYGQLVRTARAQGAELAVIVAGDAETHAHHLQREIAAQRHANEEHRRLWAEQLRDLRHHDDEYATEQQRKHDEEKALLARRHNEIVALNRSFDNATGRGEHRIESNEIVDQLSRGAISQRQVLQQIEALRRQAETAVKSGADDAHDVVARAERDAQALGNAVEQVRQRLAQNARELQRHPMNVGLEAMSTGFNTLTSSVYSNIKALVAHKETAGAALKSIAETTLESIGTRLMGQGVADIVTGISRAATSYGADPTAYALAGNGAAELAIGAGFGAAGIAVGSINTGSVPDGSSSSGGSSAASPSSALPGGSSGGSSGGGGTIVVNFGGPVWDRRGARDAVHGVIRDLAAMGHISSSILRN